jgi:hypothetical protein
VGEGGRDRYLLLGVFADDMECSKERCHRLARLLDRRLPSVIKSEGQACGFGPRLDVAHDDEQGNTSDVFGRRAALQNQRETP